MANLYGVDLGTSNTVIAEKGRAIPLAPSRKTTLPSVVSFPPSGQLLVGEKANARRALDPINTLASTKRVIGAAYHSYAVSRFRETSPHAIERAGEDGVAFATRRGVVRPEDVASILIEHLFQGAAARTGGGVVVGVPATFDARQRATTRGVFQSLKFEDIALIDEPVATAIAYLDRSHLKRAVVYDLGGGTFDFAVLDCSTYPFRVLAHGGDPFLGGDDLDRAIANDAASRVLRESGWDLRNDPVIFDRLIVAAERAKRELATEEVSALDVAEVDEAAPSTVASVRLTRARLTELAQPLIQQTFLICDEVLAKAGVLAREVEAVFLAGGSTALPNVRVAVQQYFGKRPRIDQDPMHVVAVGASLAALRPDLRSFTE